MRLVAAALFTLALAAPAAAQDIRIGSCAGVEDVYAGTGGVSVGGAWVSPRDCLGPR